MMSVEIFVMFLMFFVLGIVVGGIVQTLHGADRQEKPPTPERVVFGKHSLMEHRPGDEQPWGVMRYSDFEGFDFHYREDAEQFMALTEEGYDFSAAKRL